MVAALAIGAGAAIASGLYSAYQQAKANKANQKELDRLREALDKVQQPDFDVTQFTPEEYQVIGKYNPEVAAYVAEKNPTLVTGETADALQGKEARSAVLERLRKLSDTGVDEQSTLLQQQAARAAAQSNQGMQGQIADNMARRGMAGSGAALAQQLSAQQTASQAQALQGEQAALNAYNTRLQALAQAGQMGASMQNDANSLEAKNAGIINDFNQRTATNQNNYNQYASGVRNQAQLTNLNNAQTVANANVAGRNSAFQYNQGLRNNTAQQRYNNEIGKVNQNAGIAQAQMGQNTNTANTNSQVASGFANAAGTLANKYEDDAFRDKQLEAYKQRTSKL